MYFSILKKKNSKTLKTYYIKKKNSLFRNTLQFQLSSDIKDFVSLLWKQK